MSIAPFERLRTLSDPHEFPALRSEYVHRLPAIGLGAMDPPPRILPIGFHHASAMAWARSSSVKGFVSRGNSRAGPSGSSA